MSKNSTRQGVLFNGLSKKSTVVHFDQEHASADGGALLLKACDERLGLSARLSAILSDKLTWTPPVTRHTATRN